MPISNKEMKSKASMLKIRLSTEQHVFVLVKMHFKTSSYLEVKEVNYRSFLEKDSSTNKTARKILNKYEREEPSQV